MRLYIMRKGLVATILFTLENLIRFGSSAGRANSAKPVTANYEHTVFLTIIMSNERPSPDQSRIRKTAGSFKEGKLSSLLHLSQAPSTPSSIDIDSSTDNNTK